MEKEQAQKEQINQSKQLNSEEDPPQKKKQNRFFIIVLILLVAFLIILAVLVWFWLFYVNNSRDNALKTSGATKSQKSTPSASAQAANFENIPPLHPDFDWEQDTRTDYHFLGKQALFYDYEFYDLSGKQWTTQFIDVSKDKFMQLDQKLENYFLQEIKSRGWQQELYVRDKRLTSIAASGPVGGSYGFLKQNRDMVRVFAYATFVDLKHPVRVDKNGNQDACPCDYSFRVFISDIVPIDQLLEEAKKKSP